MKTPFFIHTAFIITALFCISAHPGESPSNSHILAEIINEYRQSKGLRAVKLSPYLMEVAELHVQDLEMNNPAKDDCNLHSWSKNRRWTSCCYRPNNDNEPCMWNKPREISLNKYRANGYEIAAWSSHTMTPEYALNLWIKSDGHHAVILNKGLWGAAHWKSMGVAMSEHHAVVWFGEQ